MTDVLTQPRPIRLKGRSFIALTLAPELPFEDWLTRLDELSSRSAGFFLRRSVVLDVKGLDVGRSELRDLVGQLAARKVRILGIEGAKPSQLASDLPPLMTDGRPASDFDEPSDAAVPETFANGIPDSAVTAQARAAAGFVTAQPIRSGQSLFYPDGDVTVIGQVASGAEVVAGGSIHVYGALRGRAMAGSTGNPSARIFCRKLEAELIAIDGYYRTAEDMDPALRGKAVQIWLEGETIKAETFG